MSGQPPPQSHPGVPPQPINPYEPSRLGERSPTHSTASAGEEGRHFHSRLDWEDRQALLRSVGPLRVAVVIIGLIWLKSCYEHVAVWGSALVGYEPLFRDAISLASAVLAVLWLAQGLLILYLCWLDWHYCDRLQAAAGGRGPWRPWSELHYRTARLSAAIWVLAMAVEAGSWLIDRWEIAEGLAQIAR